MRIKPRVCTSVLSFMKSSDFYFSLSFSLTHTHTHTHTQSAKKVKNEISSDDSPVVTTPTSKVKSGSHDNQQRKSSRRKSRVSRRQSESLICFSMSAEDTEGEVCVGVWV